MPRYVAFLRAINVGGHTVKMDRLRALFEDLGFGDVATFIASGNVIFDAAETDATALEARIAAHLEAGLGYPVATFLRTPAELRSIVDRDPYSPVDPADRVHVAFLEAPPTAAARDRIAALADDTNLFAVDGRELFWHWRRSVARTDYSGGVLERAARVPATLRNMNTVRRLLGKLDRG